MKRSKALFVHGSLIILGGLCYTAVELLWRRRTHISMLLVGGVCFDIIGTLHRCLSRYGLLLRCGVCTLAVTAVEFVSGCVLNKALRLGVWDYSGMRFHVMGQVSLLYSFFWFFISGLCWPLYRWLYGRLHCLGKHPAEDKARI